MNLDFGAVGAPGLSVTTVGGVHVEQGGVHIYKNFGNGIFNFQTTLTPSNGAANDGCGMTVVASNNWVVAGGPGRDIFTTSNQLQAGIVWAWKRSGVGWVPTPHELKHPTPKAIDLFGSAVAMDEQTVGGVVTRQTIVVGAPADDVVYVDCGSVCVFELNTVTQQWIRTSFIAPPTLAGEDAQFSAYGFFGSAVSIVGDFMVIGAKRQTASVSKQGTAFVFRRNTQENPAPTILQTNAAWGEWCLVQRIVAQTPVVDGQFGASMSLSPWNLMVGAPGGSNSPGSVSIFDLNTSMGMCVSNAQIVAAGGKLGDQFGAAVVMKSDAALIGAPGVDAGAAPNTIVNRGLVYMFVRDVNVCNAWVQGMTYFPPPAANVAEANFGTALELASGDVAISAPKGPNQQLGQGAVFTYALNTISCPSDLDGNGGIDGGDMGLFFSHWGGCGPEDQIADYNHDGCVNGEDLAFVVQTWGACVCGN